MGKENKTILKKLKRIARREGIPYKKWNSSRGILSSPPHGLQQRALFENMVIAEALEFRSIRGLRDPLSFFRDAKGHKADLHVLRKFHPAEYR